MKTKLKKFVLSAKCLVLSAALCAVGLSAFAEPDAVQLWKDGPYWATSNLGTPETHDPAYPAEYGALYTFDEAGTAVKSLLGEEWRVPSDGELKMLAGKNGGDKVCSNIWTTCNGVAGRRFFGMTSGYEDKSIFLPAAGYVHDSGRVRIGVDGSYRSSLAMDASFAWYLEFNSNTADVSMYGRSDGLSVRAVRDTPPPEPVEYLDWDDAQKKMTNAVCTAYGVVTNETATFEAGKTYVVQGNVKNTTGITVEGTAENPTRLILCDGAKLTVKGNDPAAGLKVGSTSALIICGQELGTGALEVTGDLNAAGIGDGNGAAGGSVTINGGTVTATGGYAGAGIGGGCGAAGGSVTINGGTVTATGGMDAAGIGGSRSGGNGTVTFGAKFNVLAGDDAGSAKPMAQEEYEKNHSAAYVHIEPAEPPEPEVSAESEAFAFDVREEIALAEGAVTIAGVSYSDTAWGAVDEAAVMLGWTNVATGATDVRKSGLTGEDVAEVDLPKKDGDYRLTHSTGKLTSFVKFTVSGYPLGSEGNPWEIGANAAADVIAFSNGTGKVFFNPVRGTVTKEGLETITNAMGGASFPAKLIAADGSATNDLKMVLGASGTAYDTIAEALAADEASYTLLETDGYFVSYDGNGAAGTMATDAFVPTIPTNLTANAYMAVGYAFAGWTTNGSDNVAYADRAAGVDFAQPGETLALTAKWTDTGAAVATFDALTNALVTATNQTATLPVTVNLTGDVVVPKGGVVKVYASPAVTFAGTGKFDVSGIVPQFGEPVVVGEGLAEGDLAFFDADGISKPVFEAGKVGLIARGESEEFPWVVDESNGVTAWVDPVLTNLAAVVIDNGMPMATNEIDLVALANNLAVYGYEPAKRPLNALLKVEDGGETAYVMPVEWITEQGNTYKTFEAALAAGETVVIPNFITEKIPEEIAEMGKGADGKTYMAVVVNKTAGSVADPIKATYAEGLLDLATSEKKNLTLEVVAMDAADVASSAVLSNKLAEVSIGGRGFDSVSFVDISVFFGNEMQQGCELGQTITLHIPCPVVAGGDYGVVRMHNDAVQAIPQGDDQAVDGEFFTVDLEAREIVLRVSKFSDYAVGSTPAVEVTLPAGLPGVTYVVSNLTDGTEIPATSSMPGGASYQLPIGAKVAIYAVTANGYKVEGENPYVIEEVQPDTTVDADDLPKVRRYCDGLCSWVDLNGADPAAATIVYDFQANLKTTKGKMGKATKQKVHLGLNDTKTALWFQAPCLADGSYDGVPGVVTVDKSGSHKLNVKDLTEDQKLQLATDLLDYADIGTGRKSAGKWCAEFVFELPGNCYRVAGTRKIKATYRFGDCCTESVAGRFTDIGNQASSRLPDFETRMLNCFGALSQAKSTKVEVLADIDGSDQTMAPIRLMMAGQGTVATLKDSLKKSAEGVKSVSGTIVGVIPGPRCENCCTIGEPALAFDCSGAPIDVTDPAKNVTAAFGTFTMKYNQKKSVFPVANP